MTPLSQTPASSDSQIQLAYGGMADQYIGLFANDRWMNPDDRSLVARHLTIKPGDVLDIGCGPGHLTDYLRSLGVDSIGIDLVPKFIEHARVTFPDGRYALGSMHQIPMANQSVAGILSWYSLIHMPPDEIDGALSELRRVIGPGGVLVAGFFWSDEASTFDHAVAKAYYWPVDELSARLAKAGFTEVERLQRPGAHKSGQRPGAAIAAIAS